MLRTTLKSISLLGILSVSVVGAALAAATDVVNGDVVTRVVGCYLLLSPVTRAILVGLSL